MSDIVSLDAYRQRRELEKALKMSLGRCSACGRTLVEHRTAEALLCYSKLATGVVVDFNNDNNQGA